MQPIWLEGRRSQVRGLQARNGRGFQQVQNRATSATRRTVGGAGAGFHRAAKQYSQPRVQMHALCNAASAVPGLGDQAKMSNDLVLRCLGSKYKVALDSLCRGYVVSRHVVPRVVVCSGRMFGDPLKTAA